MNPEMNQLGALVANYGLGAALSVFIAGFLGWLLRFVLKENAKREDRMAGIIGNHLQSLTDAVHRMNESMEKHDSKEEEVWRYQREEHSQMIRLLEKLNNNS